MMSALKIRGGKPKGYYVLGFVFEEGGNRSGLTPASEVPFCLALASRAFRLAIPEPIMDF